MIAECSKSHKLNKAWALTKIAWAEFEKSKEIKYLRYSNFYKVLKAIQEALMSLAIFQRNDRMTEYI